MKFLKRDLPFLSVLAVAVCMLLFSSANATRSALRYESQIYKGEVEVKNIGITLLENGEFVARRDNIIVEGDNAWDKSDNDADNDADGALFTRLLGAGESLKIGYKYDEALSVRNSGTIPQYCRMIIRRYWADETGKRLDRDVDYIDLHFTGTWLEDRSWSDAAAHPETTVLYYPSILQPGEETSPATDYLTIKNFAAASVTENRVQKPGGGYVITTTYNYDGLRFVLEVEADAVQTHNASAAMISAWGDDFLMK